MRFGYSRRLEIILVASPATWNSSAVAMEADNKEAIRLLANDASDKKGTF